MYQKEEWETILNIQETGEYKIILREGRYR